MSGRKIKKEEGEPTALDLEIIEAEESAKRSEEDTQEECEDPEDPAIHNSFQAYLDDIREAAPRILTKEEDLWLGERIKDHNDSYAFETLVLFNTRLVVKLALRYQKRFKNAGIKLMDIIQNGNLGLMKAAGKYDYTKGYRFSTYATYWIIQSIQRLTAIQGNIVYYPVNQLEKVAKLNRIIEKFEKDKGREPTLKELEKSSKFTEEEIINLWKIKEGPLYLQEKFDEEDGEGSFLDYLSTDEDETHDKAVKVMLLEDMGVLKKKLTALEYEVLMLYYGLENCRETTKKEIAKKIHKTPKDVTDIIERALEKLKKDADMLNLASYL